MKRTPIKNARVVKSAVKVDENDIYWGVGDEFLMSPLLLSDAFKMS